MCCAHTVIYIVIVCSEVIKCTLGYIHFNLETLKTAICSIAVQVYEAAWWAQL